MNPEIRCRLFILLLFRLNINNYYICFKRLTHARNETDIL
jgi:hypothetical protein